MYLCIALYIMGPLIISLTGYQIRYSDIQLKQLTNYVTADKVYIHVNVIIFLSNCWLNNSFKNGLICSL